jgi:hypothetical protein
LRGRTSAPVSGWLGRRAGEELVDDGLVVAGDRHESSPVVLVLYGRKNLAKTAGVAPEGTGSHRLAVAGKAGTFTDPDGFTREATG